MSEQILYTKYSNDRAQKYCIATDMIRTSEKVFIRKRAMTEEAKSHIKQMIDCFDDLQQGLSNSKFCINRIVGASDSYVDFEYIEGTNFEVVLDNYIENDDIDCLLDAINDFFAEYSKCATVKFEYTDKFREYFGDVQLPKNSIGLSNGNIDLIFQNVIIDKNGQWNVIDYEWVLDCMMPIRYLQYRAIYLYINSQSKRKIIAELDVFARFGFTKSELDCYKLMEENFQKWIKKGHMQLGDYYQMMGHPAIDTNTMIYDKERNLVQVYYNNGDGFSESSKQCFLGFPILLSVDKDITEIKIIPMYSTGYIKVKSCKDEEGNNINFLTNGRIVGTDTYFFNEYSPMFHIDTSDRKLQTIYIDLELQPVQNETIMIINRLIADNEKLNADNEKLNVINGELDTSNRGLLLVNEELNRTLGNEQNKLEAMQESLSWKITRPLRKVGRIVNKSNY